jgi:subtilisin family serine protease
VSKRLLLFLTVFATAIAMLAPAVSADEPDLQLAAGGKTVTESPTGSYIVVMAEEPLVATVGRDNLDTPEARNLGRALKRGHDKALERAGASPADKVGSYTHALSGFSAVLSFEEAKALAADASVFAVLPDELRQLDTSDSGDHLGLTGPGGAYDSGLTGEDVVVGVIDSGIWPEHPSFADDGSYGPHPVQPLDDSRDNCEFGNAAANPADAPFTCNNKLIGARQMMDTYRLVIGADPTEFDSARDDDGHGSHTASTAAGNSGVAASMYGEDLGQVSGMAPRARVIAYKACGILGCFTSDLAAAIDEAVHDGVDVINYSIGGGPGLPVSPDAIAFLFAADAGVFVATSAGNSGPDPATVGAPGTAPWLTTVGANTQARFYEGTAALRGGTNVKGASLTPGTDGRLPLVDAEFAGGDLCVPDTLDPAVVAGNIVLCRRGAIARAAKSDAVAIAGGLGMILYNNSDTDNLFTDTHVVPSVHIDYSDGIQVKDYIARSKNPLAEIRDTGKVAGVWASAPSMTIFSSRGPNAPTPSIIKPDITAPGLQVLAAASPYANAAGDAFQAIAGTSMSSPHVAGVFALVKEAHPEWSAAAAKSALMTTADPNVRDNDRTSKATPFGMGSGEVDPGKVDQKGSAFNPGLVYDAGFFEYLGFLCDAAPIVFSDPAGTCGLLDAIGVPTTINNLNYPSIGVGALAGVETVTRTVTSVADTTVTYQATTVAPAGYTVAVSPRRMTLAPGESATFEVTITNTSAPVGEWRFGDLTWIGRGYSVRSPIAVNAVAIGAPAEIEGTGPDGAASFDVTFGYTGEYAAAPHGLVASTVLAGAIGQDPDQAYPSGDDAAPGVVKHDIAVSGAAYLRIEVAIPGPDDIDLFLEDSSGTIVAASTAGGTDELIELVLPPDDTYTLVVHGWSIPSAPLPYAIDTWQISATPGGSLSVDAAPGAATLGESGTIDVSWTGAPSGIGYGAVSHADDAGLIGLTLVRVSTP